MTCRPPSETHASAGGITARQAEVLAYVAHFTAAHRYAPTWRDLMARFGWASTNAAQCHMEALQKKRLVTWEPQKQRTLCLTESGQAEAERWLREHPESATQQESSRHG